MVAVQLVELLELVEEAQSILVEMDRMEQKHLVERVVQTLEEAVAVVQMKMEPAVQEGRALSL